MRSIQLLFLLFFLLQTLHAQELQKVTVQFQWLNQFQFAGYIMARQKGFYKEAGLDVRLKEWTHGINMTKEVLSANADFAVARPSTIIHHTQGKDIVALYATFQSSPLVYLTTQSTGITKVSDFEGKRVMTTDDLNLDPALTAMLRSQGADPAKMQIQKHSFNVDDLIANKTDVVVSYLGNEPYLLAQKGLKPVIFDPKDYGFDFYNDILITSQKFAIQNPKLVEKMIEASLKGWEYAFNNIEESAKIIYEKYNTQNKPLDAYIYEANVLKNYAYLGATALGEINPKKIERINDIYKLTGLVQKPIDLYSFLYSSAKYQLGLTQAQTRYLTQKKEIRVCTNYDFYPIEFERENGDIEGISIDVLNRVKQKLQVDINYIKTKNWAESQQFLKEKKCDLIPSATITKQRQEYANFTSPYLILDLAIVTAKDSPFVSGIEALKGKQAVRKKGSAIVSLLEQKYNVKDVLQTQNLHETFSMVSQSKDRYTVATLPVISYYMQKYNYDNLQISGYLSDKYRLAMGVRNDDLQLLNVVQKALNDISRQEFNKINERWNKVNIEQKQDYGFYYKVIGGILLLLLLVVGSNLLLRKQKQKAQNAVNEKDESLQRLQLAQDIAKLQTIEYDFMNDQITFDKSLEKLLPLLQRGSLEDFISIVPKMEQQQLKKELEAAVREKRAFLSEHYMMTKWGELCYMCMNFKVVKYSLKSNPLKMVITLFDLTRYKQLEDELLKAKEEAEAATNAKSNFLANMSHELKTPLNVIAGMAYLIKKEGVSDSQLQHMANIENASQSLLHIINDILFFSKIETGKAEIEYLEFDLEELLLGCLSSIEEEAKQKDITLQLRYEKEVARAVIGDSQKIAQIIENLLDNAIKFTKQGKITVVVKKSKKGSFHISVNDTGVGLSKEQVETVFDPFSQVDNSSTREYGGTGIGLSLTKQLVKLLNAEIKVQSKVGIGSSFLLEIPLQAVNAVEFENSSVHKIAADKGIEEKSLKNRQLWQQLQADILSKRPKKYTKSLEDLAQRQKSEYEKRLFQKVSSHLLHYRFEEALKLLEQL